MPSAVVAHATAHALGLVIAVGHQEGGNLVRRLYGHRDKARSLGHIVGTQAMHMENRPK